MSFFIEFTITGQRPVGLPRGFFTCFSERESDPEFSYSALNRTSSRKPNAAKCFARPLAFCFPPRLLFRDKQPAFLVNAGLFVF